MNFISIVLDVPELICLQRVQKFKVFLLYTNISMGTQLNCSKLVGWLVGFYGISTFVDYLISNPFLYK